MNLLIIEFTRAISGLRTTCRLVLIVIIGIGLQFEALSSSVKGELREVTQHKFFFPVMYHDVPIEIVGGSTINDFGGAYHNLLVRNTSSSPLSEVRVAFQVSPTQVLDTNPYSGSVWITGTRDIPLEPPLFAGELRHVSFDYMPARRVNSSPITVSLTGWAFPTQTVHVPISISVQSRKVITALEIHTGQFSAWGSIVLTLSLQAPQNARDIVLIADDNGRCSRTKTITPTIRLNQALTYVWTEQNTPYIKAACSLLQPEDIFTRVYAYGVRR